MKKTLLMIAFFLAGAIIFSPKKLELTDETSLGKALAAKAIDQQKALLPAVEVKQIETASLENLEENYEDLEIKELQAALERVEKSREKLQLIEAFNSRKLSDEESQELAKIIRTRVVLTKLVMEKKFEELESL